MRSCFPHGIGSNREPCSSSLQNGEEKIPRSLSARRLHRGGCTIVAQLLPNGAILPKQWCKSPNLSRWFRTPGGWNRVIAKPWCCGSSLAITVLVRIARIQPALFEVLMQSNRAPPRRGSRPSGRVGLALFPVPPWAEAESTCPGSGSGCSTGRLLPHLLQHLLLYFLHRGLSLMGSYHPCVSVRVHDGAAPIAPKHVHHWALACGSEVEGFGDHFVRVFCVDKQTRWRGANTLGSAFAQGGVFWPEH